MFGIPKKGQCDYTQVLELDLGSVRPSVAGPKRPQDRIELPKLKDVFHKILQDPAPSGYGKAKKAVEKGLHIRPEVKTSLAPGSRVVSRYLEKTGLQPYLDKLGFTTVGYGCTTCIGNSGPLDPHVEQLVTKNDVVAASVLSGNRNFEARVHQSIKANFLMSPPLVVAFALAGRGGIDVEKDPLALGRDSKPRFLKDLWPTAEELNAALGAASDVQMYRQNYGDDLSRDAHEWNEIPAPSGEVYAWDANSTYIQEPPYFEGFSPH